MKTVKRLLIIVSTLVLSLSMINGSTYGYFSDTEASVNNILTDKEEKVTVLLNDSFENDPWDFNWDDNGTTGWVQGNGGHNGANCALADKDNNGYLTTDDLDASDPDTTTIVVSFWFKPKQLAAGDVVVQFYNGSTYITRYELTSYPTYKNNN